jgi:class 3 adenylate cyclase
VNIASRISGLSSPGEVLVSETVRSLARTSAGVRSEDRGRRKLKGVGGAREGVGGDHRARPTASEAYRILRNGRIRKWSG